MNAHGEWRELVGMLRRAQVAQSGIRDRSASQQIRDAATVEYGRMMDAVYLRLDRMSEKGVMGQISKLLATQGRV